MSRYVKIYIDACETCQNKQSVNIAPTGYLQQVQKYNLSDCWSFDHLGPFDSCPAGEKYLTVAIENIS